MFLLGAIMLPVMTVAWEQDQTEKHSFLIPGSQVIEVESPTVLGLYDLSMRRPDNKVSWDKLRLRAGLQLVHKNTGEIVPMLEKALNQKQQPLQSTPGDLGFFEVQRSGEYLLVVPEEILPEEVKEAPVYWSLRVPPDYRNSTLGLVFLTMAVVGALMSCLGLLMLVLPKIGSKKVDSPTTP